MTTDINNFITILRQKNGKLKITHDVNNRVNVYKFLRDIGFRKSKLDNRRVYYRRHNNKLTIVQPYEIKDAFHDFLKRADYTNIPDDVSHEDILEWYYAKVPFKINGLYDPYLEDTLSEQEIHSLRLQRDAD
jgi:hypothetical protein